MSQSKYEDIRDFLVAGVTAIGSVKKVFDSMSDLNDGQPFPRIEVLNGNELLLCEDTNGTVWDSTFVVFLNAFASADELEGVVHDLRKYVVSIYKSQLVGTTNRWNILKKDGIKISRSNFPIVEKILWSQIQFTVHSRFLDTQL
jgi:hypothetical protein